MQEPQPILSERVSYANFLFVSYSGSNRILSPSDIISLLSALRAHHVDPSCRVSQKQLETVIFHEK